MKKILLLMFCGVILIMISSCEKKMRGVYNCTPLEAEYNSVTNVLVEVAGKLSSSGCMYDRIEFKDDKNALVYTFSNVAPVTYVKNGNLIEVDYKGDKLVFEIVDDNTLIGKDWAKGRFVKE